jgi:DEP domain-containing protein 5
MYKYESKWRSLVTPICLRLTVKHFPTTAELDSSYNVFSYDFVIDSPEMCSFMVKPPIILAASPRDEEEVGLGWVLRFMRGMVAVRPIQGFQFILRPHKQEVTEVEEERGFLRCSKPFAGIEDDMMPKPAGAAEILHMTNDPVYLSMSN